LQHGRWLSKECSDAMHSAFITTSPLVIFISSFLLFKSNRFLHHFLLNRLHKKAISLRWNLENNGITVMSSALPPMIKKSMQSKLQ
jgi:hypothetical protein